MLDPNTNALVGEFYDTKQDPSHKPTGMTPAELGTVIADFTGHGGWNERELARKYFQPNVKLYQTRFYIPIMQADAAPKAFNCEKEVQPSRWIIVYRGNVSPPKSGKYRFVGTADDVLVVRFNRQNVFDHGYHVGTTGLHGSKSQKPTIYHYPNNPHYEGNLGYAVGIEFEARAGSTYPIEVLISEIPGGQFGASLLIEEEGVNYPKCPTGAPILPLFRFDNGAPAPATNAPPYDPNGPVWKLVGGHGKLDI